MWIYILDVLIFKMRRGWFLGTSYQSSLFEKCQLIFWLFFIFSLSQIGNKVISQSIGFSNSTNHRQNHHIQMMKISVQILHLNVRSFRFNDGFWICMMQQLRFCLSSSNQFISEELQTSIIFKDNHHCFSIVEKPKALAWN